LIYCAFEKTIHDSTFDQSYKNVAKAYPID
jgi:hypothetical protein